MSIQSDIIDNISTRLANMPLAVDISLGTAELEGPLYDAMREMGIIDVINVTDGSKQELYLEMRATWYALSLIRNESALYFKWSSGSDGKEVDKTKVFESINTLMKELDSQFLSWWSRSGSGFISGIYTRETREKKRLS